MRAAHRPATPLLAPLLAAVLVAAACASDGGTVRWRDLRLDVPDGWLVTERNGTALSLADAPFHEEAADELSAAVFLRHEPATDAADWRRFVGEQGGELEVDEPVTVGGAPGTRLVFTYDANGTVLTEMVVVVPSRDLVVLLQPVVARGSRDGPATFASHRGTFERLLASVVFGPPGGDGPLANGVRSWMGTSRTVNATWR